MNRPRPLHALALGAAIATLPACTSVHAAPTLAAMPQWDQPHTTAPRQPLPTRPLPRRLSVDAAPLDDMPIFRADPGVDYKMLVLKVPPALVLARENCSPLAALPQAAAERGVDGEVPLSR